MPKHAHPFWRKDEMHSDGEFLEEYHLQNAPKIIEDARIVRRLQAETQQWYYRVNTARWMPFDKHMNSGTYGTAGTAETFREAQKAIQRFFIKHDILTIHEAAGILGDPAPPQLELI